MKRNAAALAAQHPVQARTALLSPLLSAVVLVPFDRWQTLDPVQSGSLAAYISLAQSATKHAGLTLQSHSVRCLQHVPGSQWLIFNSSRCSHGAQHAVAYRKCVWQLHGWFEFCLLVQLQQLL